MPQEYLKIENKEGKALAIRSNVKLTAQYALPMMSAFYSTLDRRVYNWYLVTIVSWHANQQDHALLK